ncbi:uncharacterized protein LOC129376503 [Poeciliopsis prolifica]|uniref:uncharacterized protein LOC129376503 n=1 Tax=Poeciliopsis prolifica TaxID=188132 RepID=UPI0024144942|nr:uncharacterized protein LOC129376503 [Poeciliopsis prolifica]
MAASRGRVRSASSKYNGLLSFHGFPRDPALRRRWLQNIRREEMKLTQHSKVCSLHFSPDQLLRPRAAGGRRAVSRGAVPVLFPWSLHGTGLSEPDRKPDPPGGPNLPDHDYCSVPEPADRNLAVHENQKLTEEIKKQAEEPEAPSRFGLQRFTGSDDDIRFYTRFATYRLFLMFWRIIEPSVHRIRTSGTRSSEAAAAGSTHTRDSLQPIDELLLFQMHLAAGLKERDLANRFQIHPSTASRIICWWADYLYLVLGSLCVWMDADDIRAQLPRTSEILQILS